jgi:hypothetical protein
VGTIHLVAGRLPPWPPGALILRVAGRLAAVEPLICSAKGCRAAARWQLLWNNPKLHPPDRRKAWLACDDHRESLGSFLSVRGFLRDTAAIDERDRLER